MRIIWAFSTVYFGPCQASLTLADSVSHQWWMAWPARCVSWVYWFVIGGWLVIIRGQTIVPVNLIAVKKNPTLLLLLATLGYLQEKKHVKCCWGEGERGMRGWGLASMNSDRPADEEVGRQGSSGTACTMPREMLQLSVGSGLSWAKWAHSQSETD